MIHVRFHVVCVYVNSSNIGSGLSFLLSDQFATLLSGIESARDAAEEDHLMAGILAQAAFSCGGRQFPGGVRLYIPFMPIRRR